MAIRLPTLCLHPIQFTNQNFLRMKNLITFCTLFLFGLSTQLNAQFLVGGNIGFNTSKNTSERGSDESESKSTIISVIPRLGYVFGDNWAGLDAGVMNMKSESPGFPSGTDENTANLISITPFFRHIQKPTENFGIWIEAQAGAAFGKTQNNGEDDAKISAFGAGIRPGVIFFIGEHLSFEASFGRLGFNQTTVTDANDSDIKDTTSEFGLSLNNNGIGISPLGVISSGFTFGVNWMF